MKNYIINDPYEGPQVFALIDDDDDESWETAIAWSEENRKEIQNAERRHRYHVPYSLDAMDYEGESLAYYLTREEIYIQKEKEQHVKETLIYLTDAQVRRIKMKAEGMILREIAEAEGIGVNAVRESIESAKRKFKKYF
ncbi:MAG: hypothetical protein M3I20_02795 [Mogibacterium diversum]|uniref:hypothetical protein n=1 Tax=Mogibacterium diversum TaxID=114527 RepID=UPI0020486FFC|nr:hypothetical protein [Mogibacterium diversum]UQF81945.1 MAG: hypothetical protein M3I20_02795 [Mogibacterium diversum]